MAEIFAQCRSNIFLVLGWYRPKIEEPAPETGLGFFDSLQLHRRSLSHPHPSLFSSAAQRSTPSPKIPREAFV